MSVVENEVLHAIKDVEKLNSLELAAELAKKGLVKDHQDLYSTLISLHQKNRVVMAKESESKLAPSEEARVYMAEGSPEYKFAKMIAENPGKTIKEANDMFAAKLDTIYTKKVDPAVCKVVFAQAKQNGYIKIDGGKLIAQEAEDKLVALLNRFEKGESVQPKELQTLKQRKLIAEQETTWFILTKGPDYVDDVSKYKQTSVILTKEMIESGDWKKIEFLPLNFEAQGQRAICGHTHPLLKIRQEMRELFLQMGFEEMDTSKWVESSFWNFDTLFQGQQHPCRDLHDTFFLKDPAECNPIEDHDYFLRVKEMHERGGSESIGLRYNFDDKIPLTNIMRTHTTAVSSRYLKMLADHYKKTGELHEHKYFSIDRVYRNETLDQTHLAEFHQVEGFVIGKNLSLGDHMNTIRVFFEQIGMTNISFKPTYNPYTEPSMEIFAYHPALHKEIELGNSGIFRPEMLAPMGFPEGWRVIAWGFSLARPMMIEMDLRQISKIEGPAVNFDLIRNCPITRVTF